MKPYICELSGWQKRKRDGAVWPRPLSPFLRELSGLLAERGQLLDHAAQIVGPDAPLRPHLFDRQLAGGDAAIQFAATDAAGLGGLGNGQERAYR